MQWRSQYPMCKVQTICPTCPASEVAPKIRYANGRDVPSEWRLVQSRESAFVHCLGCVATGNATLSAKRPSASWRSFFKDPRHDRKTVFCYSTYAMSLLWRLCRCTQDSPAERRTQLALLLHRPLPLRRSNARSIGHRRSVHDVIELIVVVGAYI